MGFAHNLSRTIIQEQDDDDQSLHSTSSKSTEDELSDEVMALEGPPWAKEGMVTRRIAFVEDKKKSKDKTWKPLFAVAQAGTLATFTFGEGSSSRKGGGVVGGGNWTVSPKLRTRLAFSLFKATDLFLPYSTSPVQRSSPPPDQPRPLPRPDPPKTRLQPLPSLRLQR